MPDVRLHLGDCLDLLPGMEAESADAVVTDPPAGISFMGREWDSSRGGRAAWVDWLSSVFAECLRVVKPGGYALVWALPRTSHWTATALEDAGWEIRDRIAHIFGQGFPKGKGCLKPAVEDWWLCRKPGPKVLPLGIDECRIGTNAGWSYPNGRGGSEPHHMQRGERNGVAEVPCEATAGRWPANLVLDDSPEVAEAFAAFGEKRSAGDYPSDGVGTGTGRTYLPTKPQGTLYSDTGSAARFFYTAKASKADRGEGNSHPTVKPLALMEWLVKLVCPKGGTVLDPFAGSGTTLVAALRTWRLAVGIERDPDYFAIAERRIRDAQTGGPLFEPKPSPDLFAEAPA